MVYVSNVIFAFPQYRVLQKELYNCERVYKCIQRTCITFRTVII
jgi:hypothetical protein